MNYNIILSRETLNKVESYQKKLKNGSSAGIYLKRELLHADINSITVNNFLERLLNTKQPQIFAESSIKGDGSDWNETELSILGDISIAVNVVIYDNGAHYQPIIHNSPFVGNLVYTPGALLRCDYGNTPADWNEVVTNNKIDETGFYTLYQRRLLPVFHFIDKQLEEKNQKGIITIPGIGCGQFAGKFIGELGARLEKVLIDILEQHGKQFKYIKVIYYDPYNECSNRRLKINNIDLLVRPLLYNKNKSQLSHPIQLQDSGDDFSGLTLFSIVAWDHVSLPGNDFFIGSRSTDDGVKAAATNSMEILTGIKGEYNKNTFKYLPPNNYNTWEEAVLKNNIKLSIKNNLHVY